MKFACDKCNTRYSIADERVRGRVLKIRCKACNHVITVREEQPLESLSESFPQGDEHTMVSTAPPALREDAADEWFVSFDGDQEGPLPLLRAIDRVRTERPTGRECYCWRTGFFVWLPIEDVPEFAPALALPKPAPPPPLPMDARAGGHAVRSPSGSNPVVARSTGSHAAVGKATGSNPAAGKITGSNPVVARSASGSHPAVGRSPSGSNPVVGRSPSGSNPVVGRSPSGSNPVVGRSTGSQAAVGKSTRATGSQAAVGKSSGSNPALAHGGSHAAGKAAAPLPAAPTSHAHHGPMAAPAFELPGFDSGPLGTPNRPMPSLPTKPEPRVARRDEAHGAPSAMSALESGPAVSPFAAALQAGGATQVSDGPSDEINVPRPEQRLDTGPVPLPPPPGDDLPIGEASGLISLAHISKSAMPKPTMPGKSIETFGGMPVMQSGHSPLPTLLAAPGAAPRSSPGWMKWAAIAGAMATIGLGLAVVLLLTRKPLVIVVPPAPQLDDNKKVDNQPITITDTGPNPNQAPPTAAADNDSGNKHNNKQHARAAKQSKSGAGDEKLSGEQGKLAALYRDEGGEHAVSSQSVRAADRGAGGNVSQQAIMGVVTQNRRSLNLCYDRVLKHDSSLRSGRVLTHVKIGISGSVTGVNVPDPQYANSEIGQCLVQTIRRWHFPSADSEYETEFPIILQAN